MTQVDKKAPAVSNEITIKVLILNISLWYKFLQRKWGIILIACFAGATIGLLYSFLKKTVYKAELSFALEDEKSSMGGLGAAMGIASQFGIDLGGGSSGGAFSGDNIIELMKSRSMVEKALLTPVKVNQKSETLAGLYLKFNKLNEKWADEPELRDVSFPINADRSKFTLLQDSVLGTFYYKIIQQNLSVDKIDKKLSIITVKVNSKNELFSKYFSEALTKTVSDFYVSTKTKKSVQNVRVLQRQTDSVRSELNAAINGVATSTDLNPNPNPALLILRTPSQRRQVDVQANQAILTQLVANLELSKVALRRETPLIQIIDTPILPLEKDKIGKLIGLALGAIAAGVLAIMILTVNWLYKEIW